jgi:Transcriptional regulator
MNKQPQITERTRRTFIEVFCELYSQKPIEKISIQEIANRSGYNRSTFYQYFTDIYELRDSIENDLLGDIKEALENREVFAHGITNALHCLEEKEHMAILNALLGDYGGMRFLERLKNELPLDKLLLKLPESEPITPYLIEFYISTSLSLFRLWFRRQKDLPPEELAVLMHNLYTAGISYRNNKTK